MSAAAHLPPLLAISDRRSTSPADWASAACAAGIGLLLVREKDLSDHRLLATLHAVREAAPPPCRLLVSGRPDLARLAGFDGVHLPARGMSVAAARRLLPRGALVGRSTHSLAGVERAVQQGASYVVFGPVYPPLSKRSDLPSVGPEGLAEAARRPIPVFALGGVTIDRLAEIAAAGAAGAAGITLFSRPDRLAELVAAAEEHFTDARERRPTVNSDR